MGRFTSVDPYRQAVRTRIGHVAFLPRDPSIYRIMAANKIAVSTAINKPMTLPFSIH